MYGNDLTVNKLEAHVAELVGRETVLFVLSGTMDSQIAARVHADPGQEALVNEKTHVYEWEVGGFAQLSGLQVRAYDIGGRTAPTLARVRDHAHEESLHVAGTGVPRLENAHNARGGVVVPKVDVDAAVGTTRNLGAPVHLDGARLFNACVVLDEDPTAMVERVDTMMCCLSKGLSASVGSMLAGSEVFIEEVVRVRKQFGGGMHQARLIAAPGLVALSNVDCLTDGHANATILAEGLDAVSGLSMPMPSTNIVVVDSEGAGLTVEEFIELYDDVGVLGSTSGQYHTRFTMSLNVPRADVGCTVGLVADTVESR